MSTESLWEFPDRNTRKEILQLLSLTEWINDCLQIYLMSSEQQLQTLSVTPIFHSTPLTSSQLTSSTFFLQSFQWLRCILSFWYVITQQFLSQIKPLNISALHNTLTSLPNTMGCWYSRSPVLWAQIHRDAVSSFVLQHTTTITTLPTFTTALSVHQLKTTACVSFLWNCQSFPEVAEPFRMAHCSIHVRKKSQRTALAF